MWHPTNILETILVSVLFTWLVALPTIEVSVIGGPAGVEWRVAALWDLTRLVGLGG